MKTPIESIAKLMDDKVLLLHDIAELVELLRGEHGECSPTQRQYSAVFGKGDCEVCSTLDRFFEVEPMQPDAELELDEPPDDGVDVLYSAKVDDAGEARG